MFSNFLRLYFIVSSSIFKSLPSGFISFCFPPCNINNWWFSFFFGSFTTFFLLFFFVILLLNWLFFSSTVPLKARFSVLLGWNYSYLLSHKVLYLLQLTSFQINVQTKFFIKGRVARWMRKMNNRKKLITPFDNRCTLYVHWKII